MWHEKKASWKWLTKGWPLEQRNKSSIQIPNIDSCSVFLFTIIKISSQNSTAISKMTQEIGKVVKTFHNLWVLATNFKVKKHRDDGSIYLSYLFSRPPRKQGHQRRDMSCLGESSMDFERPKANATAITDWGMEKGPPPPPWAGHTAMPENKSRYEAVRKVLVECFYFAYRATGWRVPL